MIQGAGGAGLYRKPLETLWVGRKSRWQNLDRHVTSKPGIRSAVNLAHPAGAEYRNDFVRPEFAAWDESHAQKDYHLERTSSLQRSSSKRRIYPTADGLELLWPNRLPRLSVLPSCCE